MGQGLLSRKNHTMRKNLQPTVIALPDGTTYLLPAVDEPRLARDLLPLRWRTLEQMAIRWATCPRCSARPGDTCRSRSEPCDPHRARLRATRRILKDSSTWNAADH